MPHEVLLNILYIYMYSQLGYTIDSFHPTVICVNILLLIGVIVQEYKHACQHGTHITHSPSYPRPLTQKLDIPCIACPTY